MPMLDVFDRSDFSMANLTAAINAAPYKPKLLGELGIFTEVPITTTVAKVEKRFNKLALIQANARGTIGDARQQPAREVRTFNVPHVPYYQNIMADDIQGIRAFGSETELEMVSQVVNDQLVGMRADHEVTQEYHRLGAVKGIILDADMSTTIYNLFTEFAISQPTQTYESAGDDMKDEVSTTIRTVADALGSDGYQKLLVLCGDTFFDGFTSHTSVKAAYDRWREGEFLRASQLGPEYGPYANGFDFCGATWINYRGTIGGTAFVTAAKAHVVPVGSPNLFTEVLAPADSVETVNTRGQRFYASQERLPHGKGIQLHTQGNVLAMCNRPGCLVELTWA